MKTTFILLATATAAAAAGCGGSANPPGPDATPSTIVNASDVPVDGLGAADVARFDDGDELFGLPFRESDGLGPLFIRTSCGACHAEGSRGPGLVQKMVIVGADGVSPVDDQSALTWGHTIRKGLAAGATHALVPPDGRTDLLITTRIGPPVLGRGYIEAILDSEIERVEHEQSLRTDAIHGTINRVTFTSVPNPDTTFSHFTQGQTNVIGRFGLKARVATIDDFTADAYQGDMGMTTPMRPTELANPDSLTDDARAGVDLTIDHVDRVAFYLRRIAIPHRTAPDPRGPALFAQVQCAACHVPTLHTREDYPIKQLADIDAPVFTDLLLHDMGKALADGMTDQSAAGAAWRTAPLIGLRFAKTYLHDGRAASAEEAINAHDGEGKASADLFRALSADDRRALLDYVESL